MGDEEAKRKADEEAAKKAADDDAAKRASGSIASALLNAALTGGGDDSESASSARLSRLQLELSEEADLLEMEQLKIKHAAKNRKRILIQKAIEDGVDNVQLAEHLASLYRWPAEES